MTQNLARYRWHTGARLRPIDPETRVPPLFRDVGPAPLVTFLNGGMRRLAGPNTPLTYMRTAAWPEPYVDHAKTGRLVIFDARAIGAWHAGVPHVFVAPAAKWPGHIGYLPGDVPLTSAASALRDAQTADDLREVFGGPQYDERCRAELAGLERLNATMRSADRVLEPLRRRLQNGDAAARRVMASLDITESDVCTAWHHLSDARRGLLTELTADPRRFEEHACMP